MRRRLPDRALTVVTDSNFAAMELLGALRAEMTCITRLRLDARLFAPAPPRRPGTMGRPRVKGERLPMLSAVLADAGTRWARVTVAGWYGAGPRAVDLATGTGVWHHPGLPIIPPRWVLVRDGRLPVRTAAWYAKRTPTLSDALAVVRAHWWRWQRFRTSSREADMVKLPRRIVQRLSEAACYAAEGQIRAQSTPSQPSFGAS